MKIACLFYGQPRWIDNPHCFSSQQEKVISKYDCDIYAHLWTQGNGDYPTSSWSNAKSSPSSESDIEKFKAKYNPISLVAEEYEPRPVDPLYSHLSRLVTRSDFTNCLSQLYSLEKASDLITNPSQYDFIIVLRTDLVIWDYPDIASLDRRFFYLSDHRHATEFADLSFIFGPQYINAMKAYSFSQMPDCIRYLRGADAEKFKLATYQQSHSMNDLRQIPIKVRIARGLDCRGVQW